MTAQTDYDAFLNAQKEEGYSLGGVTGTPEGDMIKYTELKLAMQKELRKIEVFNLAKEDAYKALEETHDQSRIELGKLWQTKEDNDYTI